MTAHKFRVRQTDDTENTWAVADGSDFVSTRNYINDKGEITTICSEFQSKEWAELALGHYESKQNSDVMRKFDSGATRDTTNNKLDYVKALSPIVLRRYVQYLDKHRLQPDGSYRDFDNWKNGIPQEVYHSSGGRHFLDTWLLTEGYATKDNHGPVDLEDALCAQLFNIQGRLHEILKAKLSSNKVEPDIRMKP